MVPKPEDGNILLPISFDYSGGRSSEGIWRYLAAVVTAVIGVVYCFSRLGGGFSFSNWFWTAVIALIFSLVIRFPLLRERRFRRSQAHSKASDFKLEAESFWGIFEIEPKYPHLVRFKNGTIGLFVKFESGVVVGKGEQAEFDHYNALSDAYNLVADFGLGMCHIDLMEHIGNDERLLAAARDASKTTNTDLRDVMVDVFRYLQETMSENVATESIYVFTDRGLESQFLYNVSQCIGVFLQANYTSHNYMDSDSIRELAVSLFNLEDFSINEVTREAFNDTSSTTITPLHVINTVTRERTEINKSRAERKALKEQQALQDALLAKEKESRKRSGKRKSTGKSASVDNEEVQIF